MNSTRNDNSAAGAPPIDSSSDCNAGEPDDGRLVAAVQEFMRALESGQRPNRREFLARYPDIADELSECLDGLAFVNSAAVEIPGAVTSPAREPDEKHFEIDADNSHPLGDFRLIREIGRGGMGIVYEAVQLTLGRRVAVKVLPMAAALDVRHLERFRNEAQAAAQLHHTNIVPVYAVGCERSVHFYAMQLIEGQSLSEVIHDLRQLTAPHRTAPSNSNAKHENLGPLEAPLASRTANELTEADQTALTITWNGDPTAPKTPRPKTTPPRIAPSSLSSQNLSTLRTAKGSAYARSVANLGLQVAQALDYAHRAGIVHRDIKPANLLLDAKGTLWVTDFGLAQFYSENNLTRSGDMVGTMRYMSPEQASGRAVVLDQRTDIYSLGVTLYELLTLERALPGTTHAQLLDQLANYDPKPARSVDKTIPRELEIILAKAMSKDPADRYQSADLLAADLQRFLLDEPIHARPPSAWDRAVKWTRRHRSLAMSSVVTLALAATGLLISNLLIVREQGRTKTAYELEARKAIEADQQRARAEKSSRQARAAVDYFSKIADSINDPKFDDIRREMLAESLNYYQSFLEDRSEDQTVNAELDAAKARVSGLLSKLLALDAMFRAEGRLAQLSYVDVQKDLKLTSDQAKEISDKVNAKTGGKFFDPREMTTEQELQSLRQRAEDIESILIDNLGVAGAERLHQIQRQWRGAVSFGDADVVEKLALSQKQRIEIRKVESQMRHGWQNGPSPTIDTILSHLDPPQVRTWNELVGAKYTGKIPMGGFNGRGGGPGGRGPGPGGPGGREQGPNGGGRGGPGGPGDGPPRDGPDGPPRRGI